MHEVSQGAHNDNLVCDNNINSHMDRFLCYLLASIMNSQSNHKACVNLDFVYYPRVGSI